MAATPDVAMTLALLGTRFSSVGMMDSAPWSKRLPSNDDRCLMGNVGRSGRDGEGEGERSLTFIPAYTHSV